MKERPEGEIEGNVGKVLKDGLVEVNEEIRFKLPERISISQVTNKTDTTFRVLYLLADICFSSISNRAKQFNQIQHLSSCMCCQRTGSYSLGPGVYLLQQIVSEATHVQLLILSRQHAYQKHSL